jgi:16S rRNA (guanine1207-N2)-methyltransferase
MGHYFDEQPSAPSKPKQVELLLPDMALTLTTDRGVFGYGQVDSGSKLLLLKAPPLPATGDLLDLGCGAGTLAVPMARRAPSATVWAIDINGRARELCAANAAANQAHNVRVVAPDEMPDDLRFAAIWSNPPIRVGKAILHGLLTMWLDRLTPDGRAVLVVQRHLGADSLHRWLGEQGHGVDRVASSGGYRVLDVRSASRVDLDSQP